MIIRLWAVYSGKYFYIWISVVIVLLVIVILLIAKYIYNKKTNKAGGNDRKNLILRICLYVVLGVLLFVLSPLIFSAFI